MNRIAAAGRRIALAAVAVAALYAILAYALAPNYWRHFERQRGLAEKSMVTKTKLGIPGDPLNVGFEGPREVILCAMRDAGWRPADPVTIVTSARIAESVIARRAYPTAPVSPLVWEGRKQDLAFQKPSGVSPSRRHHARFWLALAAGEGGAPVWLGASTFDSSVGVSHYTGQITHHIAPDIDAERDLLLADLVASQHVSATYRVSGIGPTLFGRNGGGDRYFTDGDIRIARLRAECGSAGETPADLPAPADARLRAGAFGVIGRIRRALLGD